MKLSWGWGIGIGFGLFVVAILIMVTVAMTKEVDLVSDRYYEAGLHYQDHIKALERTGALGEQVRIEAEHGAIALHFPPGAGQNVTGLITFYRPSSKQQDFILPLAPDTAGLQVIPAERLNRGLWRVQISWKKGTAEYFAEQAVLIH